MKLPSVGGFMRACAGVAIGALAATAAPSSHAAETSDSSLVLQEVIVTAQKRQENEEIVPISERLGLD